MLVEDLAERLAIVRQGFGPGVLAPTSFLEVLVQDNTGVEGGHKSHILQSCRALLPIQGLYNNFHLPKSVNGLSMRPSHQEPVCGRLQVAKSSQVVADMHTCSGIQNEAFFEGVDFSLPRHNFCRKHCQKSCWQFISVRGWTMLRSISLRNVVLRYAVLQDVARSRVMLYIIASPLHSFLKLWIFQLLHNPLLNVWVRGPSSWTSGFDQIRAF